MRAGRARAAPATGGFVKSWMQGNYSGMLIGLPIAIRYFLARKITAEGAEERESI
ncbi:MAG: hypothetical protein U9N61_09720 [Euryarchaeota archaeon]|nr:hypothetical protein [Euryarchaeota archaeon]